MLKIKLPCRSTCMSQRQKRYVMKKKYVMKKEQNVMKENPKMSSSIFICFNFDCYTVASFQPKKKNQSEKV